MLPPPPHSQKMNSRLTPPFKVFSLFWVRNSHWPANLLRPEFGIPEGVGCLVTYFAWAATGEIVIDNGVWVFHCFWNSASIHLFEGVKERMKRFGALSVKLFYYHLLCKLAEVTYFFMFPFPPLI